MNTKEKEFDRLTDMVRNHTAQFNKASSNATDVSMYALEQDILYKHPELQLAMEENIIDKTVNKVSGKLADWTVNMDSAIINGAISILSGDNYERRVKDIAKLKNLLNKKDFDKISKVNFKVSTKYKAMDNTLDGFNKALKNAIIQLDRNVKLLNNVEKTIDDILETSLKIFSNPDYKEKDYYDFVDKSNTVIVKAFKQCYEVVREDGDVTYFHTNLNISPVFGAVSEVGSDKHRHTMNYKEFGSEGVKTDITITGKELRQIVDQIVKEPVFNKIKSISNKLKSFEKDFHRLHIQYAQSTVYKLYILGNFYRSMLTLGVYTATTVTKPIVLIYMFETAVIEASIKALD